MGAEEIILHAMERDPKKRYQKAEDMKAELDDPSKVQITGRWERLQEATLGKRQWKKYIWIALGMTLPVIILILLILLIIHRGPAR